MPRWPERTVEERFFEKIERLESGCWRWTAATLTPYGHGAFAIGHPAVTIVPAHRAAYMLFVGPIPAGRHIHHICGDAWCVNPEHLAPVAPGIHQFAHRKVVCCRNHVMDEANTHIDKRGNRHCRACDAQRHREARRGLR